MNAVAPVALTRRTSDLPMMKGATERSLGPQLIAPAVVFLASDLAAGITGQVIGVEGGRTYQGVSGDPAGALGTPPENADAWERISR